ncbi:MAG: GPI inositol-deacylase, partial [Bifidobacteriaceae bacterium]|nr:GPI inositol-deacylase [Bifidobacteriaceae bacterium]
AKALCDALDKTIDQYGKAELAVAAEMSTLEKWLLYGLDSLGFPFNPLARKAATIALTRWLLDELERTRLRRGYLADTLRKYHPLVRELLDHMVVAHPILAAGPASTRRLTTIFGIMGTIITRGLGYWAARIRRVSTTKEILKGGLADLVDRVDKADWQVKHVTPSILVSKVVTGAGKKASWIVSLPPTTPLIGGSNPMDLVSDIQGMGELPNDLVDGVLKALSDAGVKKGEQILMIGHSLGGITAAAVASCKEFRSQYSPAAIITLGSPIASIKIPEDVKVLALEHRQDVFPALAGAPNPQTPNFVTVTRDLAISNNTAESDAAKQFMGTDAHAREFYRNTLAMVDKMNDPSIKAFKQAIAPIMVRGASVTTTQYEVVRSGVRSQ